VRSVVDAYAAEGYATVAPALYDRQVRGVALDGHSPDVLAQGRALRAALQWPQVLADVAAALDAVRCGGGVGIVGFCVGGSVAWMAAQSLAVDAAVAYYGRDIVEHLSRPPACPVMLHFGADDPLIPSSDVDRVRQAWPELPLHVYPTGHGFDAIRVAADEQPATLARERTRRFLGDIIG
jgi:carboxymethylenebutenolidase